MILQSSLFGGSSYGAITFEERLSNQGYSRLCSDNHTHRVGIHTVFLLPDISIQMTPLDNWKTFRMPAAMKVWCKHQTSQASWILSSFRHGWFSNQHCASANPDVPFRPQLAFREPDDCRKVVDAGRDSITRFSSSLLSFSTKIRFIRCQVTSVSNAMLNLSLCQSCTKQCYDFHFLCCPKKEIGFFLASRAYDVTDISVAKLGL